MDRYDPQAIELRWQQAWEETRAFYTPNAGPDEGRDFYLLEMLPYPSGTMHVGQVRNYTQGDVLAHFHRRNGRRVMRPMGFDSFGLNAENAAIRDGGHPRDIVRENIQKIRTQMKRMGWAIDWEREIASHEPEYYRWTQWLFLQFLKAGQAFRKEAPVKWCPKDQTVLANERNWIGRSDGAETLFRVDELDIDMPVFTTRADTLFGARFFVMAPEH